MSASLIAASIDDRLGKLDTGRDKVTSCCRLATSSRSFAVSLRCQVAEMTHYAPRGCAATMALLDRLLVQLSHYNPSS